VVGDQGMDGGEGAGEWWEVRGWTAVEGRVSPSGHALPMEDTRLASAIRSLRIRRRWRQADLAARAGVSRSSVSSVERGTVSRVPIPVIRAVAGALELRVDLVPRWRGGDLDRLVNRRHAAMHVAVAAWLRAFAGWEFAPEVSYAVSGERGVVDVLGRHPASGALLILEMKTELVDVSELLGTMDRRRRLVDAIARGHGWTLREGSDLGGQGADAAGRDGSRPVGCWVLMADGSTNRRHVAEHAAVLRSALPGGTIQLRRWLIAPEGESAGIAFFAPGHGTRTMTGLTPVTRVRRTRSEAGPRAR
jgi:transcriptional regulator with XRE-family HTH domain